MKVARICALFALVAGLLLPSPVTSAPVSSTMSKILFEGWGVTDWYGVDSNYGIWVVNEDGTELTQLTDAPGYEGDAAWSPNRRKIAFDSGDYRSGSYDVFVMRADGTHQRQLTTSKGPETYPTWSPNGRRIAYAKGNELWTMRADGSRKRRIYRSSGQNILLWDWSPDGRWIGFSEGAHPRASDWDIFLIHPDGSGKKTLIRSDADEGEITWSPDGSRIAFSRSVDCAPAGCGDIFTARPDGKSVKNITDTPFNAEYSPAWSPDGSRIAYADEYYSLQQEADIYVMQADGSDRKPLVARPDIFDFSVDW